MNRNYLGWYKLKAQLEKEDFIPQFSEGEVWRCSIGANVGDEEDGKNQLFERPVLIFKKYSSKLFLGLPLSTAIKSTRFYHPISVGDDNGVVLLSHARTLSSKRLQRRLGKVARGRFKLIKDAYGQLHEIKSNPQ